ncbi:MAG TPA: hypothetical protein VJ696_00005, partial [Rhodanobacteraceae bacterium]|nr:hypothetical protein [Rhodanobacteraceae bacterium]
MRTGWLGLAFGYALTAAAANDGGPLRDLDWGAVPEDNGIAYIAFDVGGSLDDRADAAALQPDGNLLIGGSATTAGGTEAALARLLPSHSELDLGFGTVGRLVLETSNAGSISDVAVLPDGRIVYGTSLSESTIAIGRLLADGTPDTSFDFDGRRAIAANAFVPLGSAIGSPKILLQPDGKIIVFTGASASLPDIQVYAVATRLDSDGATDTTFGGEGTGYGRYAPINGTTPVAQGSAIARLPNGQLLGSGIGYHAGGSGVDMLTFRLSADGVLDTAYGIDGFGFVAFDQGGSLDDYLTAIAIDRQGRAVVTGNFIDVNGTTRMALARLTASGQLDATFGIGGRVLHEIRHAAVWEYGNAVAVLPDGRILVAGASALCACGGQGDAGTLTMFATNGDVNR